MMKNIPSSKKYFGDLIKMFVLLLISFVISNIAHAQWQNGTNIYNTNSGNVGVGTSTPAYKFDVVGSWAFRTDGYFINSIAYAYESSTDQYLHFKTNNGRGYLGMNSSNSLILQSNGGFVGIGTANPGYKLDVKGTIRSMELRVDVNVPADYVFGDSYSLLPLNEVELFVKKNHHLPGVPSGEEIIENGWQVGEMGNKLLEKVEELTLYMIELKKENEKLKKENEKIKQEIQRIKLSLVYENY